MISGILPLAHGRPWASGNTPLIKNDDPTRQGATSQWRAWASGNTPLIKNDFLHEVSGSNLFCSERHSSHPPGASAHAWVQYRDVISGGMNQLPSVRLSPSPVRLFYNVSPLGCCTLPRRVVVFDKWHIATSPRTSVG